MKPCWHPLSTVLLAEPRCFATEGLVRLLLRSEGRAALLYAGDRMWPALAHGAALTVEPVEPARLVPGDVVLVSHAGIPDLLRLASAANGRLSLVADSDPETSVELTGAELLGRVHPAPGAPRAARPRLHRLALDLAEAWRGRPERHTDPAVTVRDKYEGQAAHYARVEGPDLDPALLARLRRQARIEGGRVLVVGSGAGRESLGLAAAGARVVGVEFSPAMVALATAEAARRGFPVEFVCADVRAYAVAPRSFDCVLFTYDVYSFIPHRAERIRLLRRLREGLARDGTLFLSARRVRSAYERAILSLEWLALSRSGEAEWGDSHTRFIPSDGSLRRSYIHVFAPGRLRKEIEAAGFRGEAWAGGHVLLRPA